MPLLHLLSRSIVLAALYWVALFTAGGFKRGHRRLRCDGCGRIWTSSIYLGDEHASCPLCHRPLTTVEAGRAHDAVEPLASLWDVRLRAHDRVGREAPARAESGALLEALELVLDGLARSPDLQLPDELQTRIDWADFALRRAFASIDASPTARTSTKGAVQTLESGARTWDALEEAQNGREAALTIAGLAADELRAALLAATCERVKATRRADEAERWEHALAGFTDWAHPEDLL